MPIEHHVAWLSSLSSQQRGVFLSAMIHNLTIAWRCLCHAGDDEGLALERASALNEAIHAASRHLLAISAGEEDPRWIAPTVTALFLTEDTAVLDQINQSWWHAQQRVTTPAPGLR